MKFKYAILYVDNVAATLAFFDNAFGLKQKMIHKSDDYGELETGSTTLSFASLELMGKLGKSPARADSGGPSFEIAFETEDVPGSLANALAAGAKQVQEPKGADHGLCYRPERLSDRDLYTG